MTDRCRAAIAWSGTEVTVSAFVVFPGASIPPLELRHVPRPVRVRTYELEDEARVLGGRDVVEYDLVWDAEPPELARVVRAVLVSAVEAGAVLAWCAFEGSCSFDHVLRPDIANQVYGVAAGDTVWLALDDERRHSEDWRRLLSELRERVLR